MYHALPKETDSQKGIGWEEYLSNNHSSPTSSIEAVKRRERESARAREKREVY
jgi:hypothetical protein